MLNWYHQRGIRCRSPQLYSERESPTSMSNFNPQLATPLPLPQLRPKRPHRRRRLLALTSLGLAGLVAGLLSGCSNLSQAASSMSSNAESYAEVSGNWSFSSSAAAAIDLAGALSVQRTQVSGRLHAVSGPCARMTGASFPVSGAIDASGRMTLNGHDDAENAFQIAGLLAADQHSLIEPALTVTGSCAEPRAMRPRDAGGSTGQQYQAVTGNYAGTFTDTDGDALAVNASLSQPTTADANGVYHLTGTATFAGVPCLGSPVVTSSTVTGNQISATYTDSATGATVVGDGVFSADAQTLTITRWTLSGDCGADSGSGLLTHQ